MKVVTLSSATIGSKTAIAIQKATDYLKQKFTEIEVEMIDLREKNLVFSDGRNYLEYSGDTLEVTSKLMQADAIIIGTPIFQASIPGSLKNIFDLLPEKALRDKVVSIVVTAGSSKHYLVSEMQLKPILSYMKAQVLPEIVFIEGQDFNRHEIENIDIHFRLEKLVEDTVLMTEVYQEFKAKQDKLLF
ncbi:MAG: NAD(P)H-dependent oxidoreductase [Enterococcus cecorum]|nr:NAD(P)H-dependent oxidoreductase [Enterococcus cecorum]CAI3479092.1 NAD(P)H-dependent oxidoreductase [Enterococcus cecorum]